METFTIFKIAEESSFMIQWFYYQDNILDSFGVEPNGDWFKDLLWIRNHLPISKA